MSWVLGIGGYSHDASAAILHSGKLEAAVQEERLTRIKHIGGFPYEAIKFCLNSVKLKPQDLSAIAFYATKSNWDGYLWDSVKASMLNVRYTLSHREGFVNTVGYRLYKSFSFRADLARFFHETQFDKQKFFCYDHHACHAAGAFYSSPFDRSMILCVDGGGDGKTTSAWIGDAKGLREIDLGIRPPHSMGLIYTRITRYLGFPSPGDEYKVMGLAAYGKPTYFDKLAKMIILEGGSYRLNMNYFNYQYDYALSDKFYEEFGPPRDNGEVITTYYADIAASVQKLFEDVLLYLAVELKKRTGIRSLAISGGSALNCKANGKLVASGEFDGIFVPPGASDLGTSIGAAQYHSHQVLGNAKRCRLKRDDWGPQYSEGQIREELVRSGIAFSHVDKPAWTAAELIAQGRIVGWFQGRMEFGPRTLGYRSILADPRSMSIKDRVNKTIKFREQFRPFAPSCLREHVDEYFARDIDCPFMTLTLDVLPQQRAKVAGVVHVDGSGRLQTVSKAEQPLYHALISRFYELTGVPIVLNTSFNLGGEPIVCSPYDALRTFFTCGLDDLVIGNYLISKTAMPKSTQ